MQEYIPDPRYKVKKKNWMVKLLYYPAHILYCFNRIEFKNIERLQPLRDKPFILLPRHKSWRDIPLNDMLLKKSIKKYGNYIMKASLPKMLQPFGGLSIIRNKDLTKIKRKYEIKQYLQNPEIIYNKNKRKEISRRANRYALEEANQRKKKIYSYEIPNLLSKDEIIILYLDGTRIKEPTRINSTNLQKLKATQRIINKPLVLVPVDSDYKEKEITLTVGNQIELKENNLEDVVEHLRNEVDSWY